MGKTKFGNILALIKNLTIDKVQQNNTQIVSHHRQTKMAVFCQGDRPDDGGSKDL
jgi:hypothetical protein